MADNEAVEESGGRGTDWEVVSLTASTYAAAPSPAEVELKDDDKGDIPNPDKAETSGALFMSRHFSLRAAQQENSPLEEIADVGFLGKHEVKVDAALVDATHQGRSSRKDEKDWAFKGLSVPDEFPGLHFLDEKSVALSVHGSVFEEGENNLQGLKNLADEEARVYSSAAFTSFHSNAAPVDIPPSYVGNMTVSKAADTSDSAPDSPDADVPQQPKQIKVEKFRGFDLPCGAWWKRTAASFYAQAKEANAFWSVFVAAAVMGVVVLGQRWQQEKWQVLQLRWRLSINNE